MDAVLSKLDEKHPGILKQRVSQMYGFANFDEQAPSLKSELEKIAGSFVNGKYLYDKKREIELGKPIIKLNRPYNHLLFDYLGIADLEVFLELHIKDTEEYKKQLALLKNPQKSQNHYYVSYHFGEYKEIVKAQVVVKDNWKRIEFKYVYPQSDGTLETFEYFGDIKKRADALHINTRTYLDGKIVPAGENILYIGYGDPAKSKYILGVFSAFDINNRLIAVKSIIEKCSSLEELQKRSLEKKVPGYIVQEIRNERIENEIRIPNDKLEISNRSPYYLTYEKIAGNYTFSFNIKDHDLADLSISIDPNNYKISSLIPGVLINYDDIQLIQNGSILNFRFKMTGLSSFLQLDIYVKMYYLKEDTQEARGTFCGVDYENRLVSGETVIQFKAAN